MSVRLPTSLDVASKKGNFFGNQCKQMKLIAVFMDKMSLVLALSNQV